MSTDLRDPYIITVDLASKFSAVMVRELGGRIVAEYGTADLSAFELADLLQAWTANMYDLEAVLIEDVPYGISSQAMVKPVLRLQGILIHALSDVLDKVYFINPSSWQREYPGVARGEKSLREQAARMHAKELGYEPPDLVGDYLTSLPEGKKPLKKFTGPLAKRETDHIDSFLMSDWLIRHKDDFTTKSGVQQVFI